MKECEVSVDAGGSRGYGAFMTWRSSELTIAAGCVVVCLLAWPANAQPSRLPKDSGPGLPSQPAPVSPPRRLPVVPPPPLEDLRNPALPQTPLTPQPLPGLPGLPSTLPTDSDPPMPKLPVAPPPQWGNQSPAAPPGTSDAVPAPQALPTPSPLPRPATSGRVVLLKDDRLLEGEVHEEGDKVILRRGVIDQEFSRSEVMFIGSTREEAYQYRRSQVQEKDIEGRIRLAKWCAYSGLREQGLAEARSAVALDPENGTARELVRILEESLRRFPPQGKNSVPDMIPPASHRTPQTPPSLTSVGSSTETLVMPAVGTNQSTRPSPSQVILASGVSVPSPVERLLVSAEVVAGFRRNVQPILTNLCVSCHSRPDAGSYRLIRMPEWDVNAAALEQNVKATLAQLRPAEPEASPLLVKAISAHGNTKSPPLPGANAPAYKVLAEWVRLACEHMPPPAKPADPSPARTTLQAGGENQSGESLLPPLPAMYRRPTTSPPGGVLPLPPVSQPPPAVTSPASSSGVTRDPVQPTAGASQGQGPASSAPAGVPRPLPILPTPNASTTPGQNNKPSGTSAGPSGGSSFAIEAVPSSSQRSQATPLTDEPGPSQLNRQVLTEVKKKSP